MKKYNLREWIKPVEEQLLTPSGKERKEPIIGRNNVVDFEEKLKDRLTQLRNTKTQPLVQKYASNIIAKLSELKKTKSFEEILDDVEKTLAKFKKLEKEIKPEDLDKFNKLTSLIASTNSEDIATIAQKYGIKKSGRNGPYVYKNKKYQIINGNWQNITDNAPAPYFLIGRLNAIKKYADDKKLSGQYRVSSKKQARINEWEVNIENTIIETMKRVLKK